MPTVSWSISPAPLSLPPPPVHNESLIRGLNFPQQAAAANPGPAETWILSNLPHMKPGLYLRGCGGLLLLDPHTGRLYLYNTHVVY